MQAEDTAGEARGQTRVVTGVNGVVALSGYGVSIRVERGELEVRDGIGRDRGAGRFHRATGRVHRLVVLGHTGSISLEAIRWLSDVGAAYVQIDRDGEVLAAFGPRGTDRPALRRAQALALGQPIGAAIGRRLLVEKLHGQRSTLANLGDLIEVDPTKAGVIANLGEALEATDDPPGLRLIEAHAALAYWGTWSDLPVRFAHRDRAHVPGHWATFGSRTSPLTGGSRLAGNPANAILNYLYALLEAEASIAAHVVGLDPGLGVIHADQPNRDSLAMDLMEPIRPMVDRYVIDLLARRTFSARDFFETREGVCRIMPGLAKELAQTTRIWFRAVGRVAEDVARMLESGGSVKRSTPTPISERRRSAGRGAASTGAARTGPLVTRTCTWCGAATPAGRRTCRGECEASERQRSQAAFVAAGVSRSQAIRQAGVTPSPESDERLRIADQASNRVAEARRWQREHRWPAPGSFERDIVPAIATLSAAAIARATGLSRGYCQLIKRGEAIPHPMWWERIRLHPEQAGGGGM